MSLEHVDLTSIHRFAYVSNTDPGAVGANKGWVDTSASTYVLRIRNAGNTGWNDVGAIFAGANIGTGIGVFKQVSGTSFQFKKLEGGTSTSISVTNHPIDTDSIAIDVVPANITISSFSGNLPSNRINTSTATLLGRTTAGSGAVEQITIGKGLSLGSGILAATSYSIYNNADVFIAADPLRTAIFQTVPLVVGTYALELYIPCSNGTSVPRFYFDTTASVSYYVADWTAQSSVNSTVGTPIIKNMKSFDVTEVFAPSGLENTESFIKMNATIVIGTSGKLTLQSFFSSIIGVSDTVYRGAHMVITLM